jgi:hypothetical protein
MSWLRRATIAVALVAGALPAAPASAAASLTTGPATQIGSTSVTLNGQESGYSSSDYCSFIYWPSGQPSSWSQAYEAVACGTSYLITSDSKTGFFTLQPDTQYGYAAIHCATVTYNTNGRGAGCAPATQGGTPWDAIDPCYSNPSTCPSFTTESSNVTMGNATPVRVGVVSAVLKGTASNYSSSDYCSFIYVDNSVSGSQWGPPYPPAVPCGSTYTATVTGLVYGHLYQYAAIHCAAVGGQPSGPYYCESNGSYANPNPWDTVASCQSTGSCQQFVTTSPSATTGAASNVLGSSATLNGTLDIEDLTSAQSGVSSSNVEYYFEYSTDPTFAAYTSTPAQYLPDANSFASCPPDSTWPWCPPVSASVTGLTPGTTYYYRTVVLAPEAGVTTPSYGSVVSFTTGGRAITDPATAVSRSGATLNGEVAAGDSALTYSWVYSTANTVQNGLLQGTTVSGGVVQPGQDELVSATVANLSPGTSYYFQLQTDDPFIHGAVLSFTTAGTSCPAGATLSSGLNISGTGFVVSGCWTESSSGVWTGYGPLTLNGLSLSGPLVQTVQIDTARNTITTSSGYSLGLGSLGLVTGAVTFNYSNSGGNSTVTVVPDPSASWFGFPLLSSVSITAFGPSSSSTPGGAQISIPVLGLPALFGGITAQGTGTVNADGSLAGLEVQVGESTLGPLQLPSVTFCYQSACPGASTSACQSGSESQPNTWFGDAELYFPLAKAGVGACVEVQNGRLNALGASYSGPGIPIDETGLSISGLSASAVINPFSFGGSITLEFGPEIEGTSLLSGTVGFNAAFNQNQTISGLENVGIPDGYVLPDVPFTLRLTGQLAMLGFITLANSSATFYDVPGSPLVTAAFGLPQALTASCPSSLGSGQFGIAPSFALAGAADAHDFNFDGTGGVSVDLCGAGNYGVSGDGVISSKGIAVCAAIPHLGYYAIGADWPTTLPTSLAAFASDFQLFQPDQCDLSSYLANVIPPPAGAASANAQRAHAALALGVLRLPSGLPFEVIRVRGRGAPPLMSASGPRGLRFAMVTGRAMIHGRGYLVIADPLNDTTYIELIRPAAGRYRLTALPGSAAIESVSAAHGLPAPTVHASITGSGATRTLTWRTRPVPGRRLVFREVGAGGDRLILSTSRARGRLRYRLAPGLPGRRYVVVQVLDGGMLQKVSRVGSYTGPVIAVPRRPLKLHAVRSGATLTATWREPGERPDSYLVLVSYANRARRLYIVRSPRLLLHGVPVAGPITVTVTAEDALHRRGPSATTTATKPRRGHRRR